MKNIFKLCLAGALALASTACNDKDDKDDKEGGGNPGEMTVNGQTETIKSAFYLEVIANQTDEARFAFILFNEAYTTYPENQPAFFVEIMVSESLCGKTIDLTKPLDQSKKPGPYLYFGAASDGKDFFKIGYHDNKINVLDGNTVIDDATVTSGTLTATKNGDTFTVKLSIKLSNGNSIIADWEGTATKLNFE